MAGLGEGDFACVPIGGAGGALVGLGERLCGDAFSRYQHAFVYVGGGQVVQAEPHGAEVVPLAPQHAPGSPGVLWSSGRIALTDASRAAIVTAARACVGTPYSFLDYGAIALHRLHVPVPLLRARIEDTGRLICSQLVDLCYAEAGIHLFRDGRWPGFVTPSDLAGVLEAAAEGQG